MGLQDLLNRRTGRPPGSKSSPAWVRALRWAERNLGRPDAEPPSALAQLLVTLGREHPDRFVACLAVVDAPGYKLDHADERGSDERQKDGNGLGGKPPQRVRNLFIDGRLLVSRLTGNGTAWISNLPRDAWVVGCKADASRDGIVLTIYSATFPPITDGETVPELTTVQWSR